MNLPHLPPFVVINLDDDADEKAILRALHRMLEAQHLAFHILYKEIFRMNEALDALNKKADDLATAVNVETTKVDGLLQGQADLKAQIATLQGQIAAGNPITAADLAGVTAKLDQTLINVNAEVAKIDPAAPPVVLPEPAPAAPGDAPAAPA